MRKPVRFILRLGHLRVARLVVAVPERHAHLGVTALKAAAPETGYARVMRRKAKTEISSDSGGPRQT